MNNSFLNPPSPTIHQKTAQKKNKDNITNMKDNTKLEHHISYSAGAGSGKTYKLIETIKGHMSKRKCSLKGIVAMTFTRKAAAELRQRLLKVATKKLDECQANAQKDEIIFWEGVLKDIPQAKINTIHGICTHLLQEHGMEIGINPNFITLEEDEPSQMVSDVFNHVIQEIMEGAGKDNNISLMSRYPKLKEMVLDTIGKWEVVGNDVISSEKRGKKEFENFFYKKCIEHLGEYIHVLQDGGFVERAEQLVELMVKAPVSGNDPIKIERLNELKGSINRLKYVVNEDISIKNWNEVLPRYAEFFTVALNKECSALKSGRPSYFVNTKMNWKKAGIVEEYEKLENLYLQFKNMFSIPELCYGIKEIRNCDFSFALKEQFLEEWKEIISLILKVYERYQAVKDEMGVMDFTDLLIETNKLFKKDKSVLKSFIKQTNVILIDEFQDTNPVQFELVNTILENGDGLKPLVFIVGDEKQSIYRFRNAKVHLFAKAANSLVNRNPETQNGVKVETKRELKSCWRMLENPLKFNNYLFGNIWDENDGSICYTPLMNKRVDMKVNIHKNDTDGDVAILQGKLAGFSMDDEADLKKRDIEAMVIAQHITDLIQQESRYKYSDIAILIPTRTHLGKLTEKMKKKGLPYCTYKGAGFYQRPEIGDIINIIRVISNRYDDISLVGLLRSPWFSWSNNDLAILSLISSQRDIQKHLYGKEDPKNNTTKKPVWTRLKALADENQKNPSEYMKIFDIKKMVKKARDVLRYIMNLQKRNRYLEIHHVLEDALTERGIWLAYGSSLDGLQCTANMEKMLDILKNENEKATKNLHELADEFTRRVKEVNREGQSLIRTDSEDAVVIMTLHAAKGLQFPIVYLYDVGRDYESNINKRNWYEDDDLGIVFKVNDLGGDSQECGLFTRAKKCAIAEEKEEQKRMFYVACTRCQDRLYLVGSPDRTEKKAKGWWPFLMNAGDYEEIPLIGEEEITNELSEEKQRNGGNGEKNNVEGKIIIKNPMDNSEQFELEIRNILIDKGESKIPKLGNIDFVEEHKEIDTDNISDIVIDLTPTGLKGFMKCTYSWYLQKVLGVTDDILKNNSMAVEAVGGAPKGKNGLKFGNLVHRMFEILDTENAWDDVTELEKILTNLAKSSGIMPERVVHEGEPPKDPELPQDKLRRHYYNLKNSKTLTLEGYPEVEVSFSGENWFLHGFIDRLQNMEGKWEIIDYKTDALEGESVEKYSRDKYELQMKCYAMMVSELASQDEVRARVIYTGISPKNGDNFYTFNFGKGDFIALKEEINGFTTKIQNAQKDDKFDHDEKCDGCWLWQVCRYYKENSKRSDP